MASRANDSKVEISSISLLKGSLQYIYAYISNLNNNYMVIINCYSVQIFCE